MGQRGVKQYSIYGIPHPPSLDPICVWPAWIANSMMIFLVSDISHAEVSAHTVTFLSL